MKDFEIKPRTLQSLMPCDDCIDRQMRNAAQGDLNPSVYCAHRETVSIIDGAFLYLHQCYSKQQQAFAIVMDVGRKSVVAWKEETYRASLRGDR